LSVWWVWMVAAGILAMLELLAPAFVFLGFAVGAAATGLLQLAGGPFASWLDGSVPLLALFFAVVSLLAWLAMRRIFGLKGGSVKTFEHDINDD